MNYNKIQRAQMPINFFIYEYACYQQLPFLIYALFESPKVNPRYILFKISLEIELLFTIIIVLFFIG